jgi:DNA-binding CsgD family transcriptional regulator
MMWGTAVAEHTASQTVGAQVGHRRIRRHTDGREVLSYRQRRILELREQGVTAREIGEQFHITIQRVYQIQAEARKRLAAGAKRSLDDASVIEQDGQQQDDELVKAAEELGIDVSKLDDQPHEIPMGMDHMFRLKS